MASDEIIQKSLDYLHSQKVHDKLVNAINDNDISSILDVVQDCYTQGRADAVQELETKARHWCMADPESSLVPKLSSWRLFDHLFIKLPGGEND